MLYTWHWGWQWKLQFVQQVTELNVYGQYPKRGKENLLISTKNARQNLLECDEYWQLIVKLDETKINVLS